jgi:hypothetical protein
LLFSSPAVPCGLSVFPSSCHPTSSNTFGSAPPDLSAAERCHGRTLRIPPSLDRALDRINSTLNSSYFIYLKKNFFHSRVSREFSLELVSRKSRESLEKVSRESRESLERVSRKSQPISRESRETLERVSRLSRDYLEIFTTKLEKISRKYLAS